MNPRLFCRERGYQKALLLTYSFDPMFFESMVLPDLWAGGSGDVLVIGDRNQIDIAMQSTTEHLWHLGKRYLLAAAAHTGSFHPKILLRLGPKGGIIMVGSGNLTSAGWGGNREVATGWTLGPGLSDEGGWLTPFLENLRSWCSGELERAAVQRMLEVPWLRVAQESPAVSVPVLHTRATLALAPQLAERWSGRRFTELQMLTGSTDEGGAFLRWAHQTFGVERAVVGVSPSRASFRLDSLLDLPLELRICPAPTNRALHAKFCWFDGPDGPAALAGSANCSAAAWLQPPHRGGNIESIAVYDSPDPEGFAEILGAFDEPSLSPAEVLVDRGPTPVAIELDVDPYRLAALQYDATRERLLARLEPSPPTRADVALLLADAESSMLPTEGAEPGAWECALSAVPASGCTFGAVRVRTNGSSFTTKARWIDDVVSLHHASTSARLLEPFRALEYSTTSAEQRQALETLAELAHALLEDRATFGDPPTAVRRRHDSEDPTAEPAPPVNPQDLVCQLSDSARTTSDEFAAHPQAFSIRGILSLLFDDESGEQTPEPTQADNAIDDTEELPQPAPRDQPSTDARVVEDKFRRRLAALLTEVLDRVAEPGFAADCSARQLVEVAAFPLAVALRGRAAGWATEEDAEGWSSRVCSVLLRGRSSNTGGLLHTVAARYSADGKDDAFRELVGDGTLWVALVAALGKCQWHGVGAFIDKAVALREVFTSSYLTAGAQAARVRRLLGRIRIDEAQTYFRNVAPEVTTLLDQADQLLREMWVQELRDQVERNVPHRLGDLLWRENVGWAVCLEDLPRGVHGRFQVRLRGIANKVAPGFYVNVTDLARRNAELSAIMASLSNRISNAQRASAASAERTARHAQISIGESSQ